MSMVLNDDSVQILEVWNENLEAEMTLIREVVKGFPFVAIDTAFPGIASPPPLGNFETIPKYNYATLRTNVNSLNMIQLGLTFSDENGNLPTFGPGNNKHRVWQFNFREFDPSSGDFDRDSIELLRQAGIDFEENNRNGVDSRRFAELLMSSGVVMNGNARWVMFHGAYDFGYLLKLLSARDLPETLEGFFEMIRVYFPRFCDVKHLAKFCSDFRGGLNKLAEVLGVERIGICHQAGSDSLLTSRTFMTLHQDWFNGSTDKYTGVLFGFGAVNGQ